jgi:hypothetical protein
MGKKKNKGQAKKTQADQDYERMVAEGKQKNQQKKVVAPETSDVMKEMLSGLAGGDGDPKDMLNQLLSKFLGGGMMGEPEAPKINKEELFSELDTLVTGIDARIEEYSRMSGSILTEDFSNLEDLLDVYEGKGPPTEANESQTEVAPLNATSEDPDYPWDQEKETTMRERYSNYHKLCLIMETSDIDRKKLVDTIAEIPEDSVCRKYQKTLTNAIDAKMVRHKKLQRILRGQYLDTLKAPSA